MNNTLLRNFIETQLDNSVTPDRVFHKVRSEFPDDLPQLSSDFGCEKPGGKALSACIETLATSLNSQRTTLLSTPLGKRFYELCRERMQFKRELLDALECKLKELREADPGTNPNDIEQQFGRTQAIAQTVIQLDNGEGHEGALVRALIEEAPELRDRAAELYPTEIPIR
jgi:hypothetical protein